MPAMGPPDKPHQCIVARKREKPFVCKQVMDDKIENAVKGDAHPKGKCGGLQRVVAPGPDQCDGDAGKKQ